MDLPRYSVKHTKNADSNNTSGLKRLKKGDKNPNKKKAHHGHTKNSVRPLLEVQRTREILKMRNEGRSLMEIAEHFGICRTRVHDIIQAVFKELKEDVEIEAKYFREIDTKKLERAEHEVDQIIFDKDVRWTKEVSIKGEMITVDVDATELRLKAMDRLLKIQERRATLWGYDAKKADDKPTAIIPIEQLTIQLGDVVLPMLANIVAGKPIEGATEIG